MFQKLLATQDISSKNAQELIRNYFLMMFLISSIDGLIIVFFSLFLINLFGVILASFLLSLANLIRFIIDFPSGVLSDWIGQKRIAFIAMFLLGIGNILTGLAPDYTIFIFIMILDGISTGLYSGVIQTWFGNNYKFLMTSDTDRSLYGKIRARIKSLTYLLLGVFVIIGTQLSFYFSRNLVFILAGVICILSSLPFFFLTKDFYSKSTPTEQIYSLQSFRQKIGKFFTLISHFFKYLIHDKLLLSTLFGILFFSLSVGEIFLYIILYPIIFSYTKNDIFLGLSQTILYFIYAILVFFISIYAKKFHGKNVSLFTLLYAFFLNFLLILTLYFIPATSSFNITGIIAILLIFLFFNGFVAEIISNLQSRILLDVISSEFRNSTLSFYSSLLAIFTSLFYIIVGIIINNYGLIDSLLFMALLGILGGIFLLPTLFNKATSN